MKKPFLPSIEYIRGLAMLGVVAIHTGSQYLLNPTPNIHLVALFEIVSRFSVPIFFFISAFGLFYRLNLAAPFEYGKFLRRRFKAVLIPYLLWSSLYLLHDNWFYGWSLLPAPDYAAEIYFFGLAKYHLYFLVILIWFYLLMPLWIFCVRRMTPARLLLLLAAQIAFDFWSSYCAGASDNLFMKWRLLRVHIHFGRRVGSALRKILRVVFAAKKNYQRDIFYHADGVIGLVLFSNPRRKLFTGGGCQHRSSTFAARHFLHNRRVDIFLYTL